VYVKKIAEATCWKCRTANIHCGSVASSD